MEEFDREFSQESVEVLKELESVYETIAQKYGKQFMRAADYVSCSEADQEHMDKERGFYKNETCIHKIDSYFV